jgi:hypothetical protein
VSSVRNPLLHVQLGLLCVILGITSACECSHGDAECSLNVAYNCESDFDGRQRSWHGTPCRSGSFCVVAQGNGPEAVCSLGIEPDPDCPGTGTKERCSGRHRIYCVGGYRTEEQDCGAPSLCVERSVPKSSVAFCTLTGAPDVLCDPDGGDVCDGSTVVDCREGYRVAEEDCPVACAAPANGTATCTLSGTTDERCYSSDPEGYGLGGFCEGDNFVECYYGYPQTSSPCDRCEEDPTWDQGYCP